jgi:hypothetical protein
VIELTVTLGSRDQSRDPLRRRLAQHVSAVRADAVAAIAEASAVTGLPAANPLHGGDAFERLVDSCIA